MWDVLGDVLFDVGFGSSGWSWDSRGLKIALSEKVFFGLPQLDKCRACRFCIVVWGFVFHELTLSCMYGHQFCVSR